MAADDVSKKKPTLDTLANFVKNKAIKLGIAMPEMDKEVMIKIAEQFPEYGKFSNKGLKKLTKMHEASVMSSEKSQKHFYKGNQDYRDALKYRLRESDLSPEERDSIYEKIENSLQKDFEKDTEHKILLRDALLIGGTGIVAAFAIGVVALGGKAVFQGVDSPDKPESA